MIRSCIIKLPVLTKPQLPYATMHRQNRNQGQGTYSGNSWSTVGGDTSKRATWSVDGGPTRPPRPRHLRGKAIGLYYRDLARAEYQRLGVDRWEEKQRRKRLRAAITLRIPPKVLERMTTNLQTIRKMAQRLKIHINTVKSLKEMKDTSSTMQRYDGQNVQSSYTSFSDESYNEETPNENAETLKKTSECETTDIDVSRELNTSSDFEQQMISKKPKISEQISDYKNVGKTENTGDNEETNKWELNNMEDVTPGLEEPDVFKKPSIITKTPKKDLDDSILSLDFIPLKTEPKPTKTLQKTDSGNSSMSLDFIPIDTEPPQDYGSSERVYSLRGGGDYKYGYQDIITGTFDEKLDECLSKGVAINTETEEIKDLNLALNEDYKDMQNKNGYKRMMSFREKLPTFKKTRELLDVVHNNQVVVISGETGCGKSTQVPQIILDDAICNNRGANCKILVTQPRRIAASSLAKRVSEERGEHIGQSVGYAVRLEKKEPRPRGSILFVTTGILLADLEVNQSLTNYSHVILDEVHERDCHIDLSMCLLKKVLKKRKDLKLILMSATIDADTLSKYFDDCPMMHIEGLAYPVKDVYLEEIIEMTKFELPPLMQRSEQQSRGGSQKWKQKKMQKNNMEKEIQYRAEVGPWLESIKHQISHKAFWTLLDQRIEELNHDLIVALLIHICKGPPGAILVFLPGIGDITKLVRIMGECRMFPESLYKIYSLHSKLPSLEQHQIFERPPENIRKIIIATNIAETSITIDDIVYVVDCAKMKITGLQVDQNISTLNTEWVSQANLRQRRGRSGRCQPGICYHLVSTFRAKTLAERTLPELQRSNLLEPVLTIKRLRLGNADRALSEVPSPPNPSTVQWAVRHLQQCGALDATETLTPLGWHLARLPVHPSAGKLLLLGALFGCLDRAASVAAVWGFKDPFQMVIGKEEEVDAVRRRLALGEPSDQVAISEAIIQWERQGPRRKAFAYQNFLSNNTLELLSDMKVQLGDSLRNMGFLASGSVKSSWENRNSDNLSLFKAIVAASLYPNFAMVKWTNLNAKKIKQIRCSARDPESGKGLTIHPSSVMALPPNLAGRKNGPVVKLCNNPGANWMVYWLKQKTKDLYLFEVTLVYTLPLLFFAEVQVVEDEDETSTETDSVLSISGVKVRCTNRTAELLFRFRALLDQVLAAKVGVESNCATRRCEFEELVLNGVIELITAEDERAEYLGGDDSESDYSDYDSGPSQSWR